MATSLNSLTLDQILKTEGLPSRLIVFFASQCAKDAMSKLKAKDPRSMLAVEVSERYGNGEDFSQEYLKKVCDDANAYAAYYAAYAAQNAASAYAAYAASYAAASAYAAYAASYAAASAASAANAAYYAAYAAYYAAYAIRTSIYDYSDAYKPLLIEIIESRLTTIEKLLIFN